MECFKKFKESLPSKDKSYSSLTGHGIRDENYKHAKV